MTSVTSLRRFSLEARADFLERLNSVTPSATNDHASSRLVRALARGGGCRVEREALVKAMEGVHLHLSAGSGDAQIFLTSRDEERWGLALDLLAVASVPGYHLRRCFNDGLWFSPALRSARSKFCSQSCRNRFNYEMRERQAQFVCVECGEIRAIDTFSGLALETEIVEPADVHAAEPLCVWCVNSNHAEWMPYVNSAELITADRGATSASSNAEYVAEIHRLIYEVLETTSQPQSLKAISAYVTERMSVRGRPELTILGHLLRFPGRYKQVSKNMFVLPVTSHDESATRKVEA